MQKQNNTGETALHHACKIVKGNLHFQAEDVAIIECLMKNEANSSIATSTTKEAPMHYVASSGNADVLKELLRHLNPAQIQLTVNQQSATGWSPLCLSSAKGHTEITKILLDNFARVDVFDHEGKSSLHLAAEGGYVENGDVECSDFEGSYVEGGDVEGGDVEGGNVDGSYVECSDVEAC